MVNANTRAARAIALGLRERAELCAAMVIYERATKVKGFFGPDDAMHFSLALGLQQWLGISGDILEIGSYFGRSSGFLANYVRQGERLVVCDTFERETPDKYPARPTVPILKNNIIAIAPDFRLTALMIHDCFSRDMVLGEKERFRCIHVDGGHSHAEALGDLRIAVDHLLPGGLLIVDDYKHAIWPEVTAAVDEFLRSRSDLSVAASMNRWTAIGQKLYLVKRIQGSRQF